MRPVLSMPGSVGIDLLQCFKISGILVITSDRLQHGQHTRLYRKTSPILGEFFFFLAGRKTIGAMMLYFGSNTSQPIPNKFAHIFFSKNGQVKFWPDNENFQKSIISLLQLEFNRNERYYCVYPLIFAQIGQFSYFLDFESIRITGLWLFLCFLLKKKVFIAILKSFFEKIMSKPKSI